MSSHERTQVNPAATTAPPLSRVSSALLQRKCACGGGAGINGNCEDCQKDRLQRHPADSTSPAMTSSVPDALRSPGRPLDSMTRTFMERRFGHDFSQVRVHTDEQAVKSAREVNALAYTVGHQVIFGAGQYEPANHRGQKLLAHELTHVVQQTARPNWTTSSGSLSQAEAEADRQGEAVHDGQTEPLRVGVSPGSVQFKVDTEAFEPMQSAPACPCNPPILKGEDCAAKGHDQEVFNAFSVAAGWLPNAQQEINDFISNPANRSGSKASSALQGHFGVAAGSTDELDVAKQVSGVIKRTLVNISNPICSHCPDQCSTEDNDAKNIAAISPNAWANTNCYSFCPTFFTLDKKIKQPTIALHEMMHSWERMGDAAYENQGSPTYPPATPIAKVTADCYACLIRDLR